MSADVEIRRRGAGWPAYAAAARVAARHAWATRGDAFGRTAFLGVLLFIFGRLWHSVAADGGTQDARAYLWYLAVTEWVLLSVPGVHLDVMADVRSGDLAYRLSRPVSYVGTRVAEAMGTLFVRMAILGPASFAYAWIFSGGLPDDPRGLALGVPLGLLAGTFGVAAQAGIGLTAVWIQDVSPVYWVWQKLAFVLGGLILPLHLYPGWLRAFAAWTPFSAFLNGPARVAFGWDPAEAALTAASLLGWILATALGVRWLHRRALAVLDVNGG